jgi:hypothetical protein
VAASFHFNEFEVFNRFATSLAAFFSCAASLGFSITKKLNSGYPLCFTIHSYLAARRRFSANLVDRSAEFKVAGFEMSCDVQRSPPNSSQLIRFVSSERNYNLKVKDG